jgi:hypothetical protein
MHLKVGVAPIREKIKESCLKWFGHLHPKY